MRTPTNITTGTNILKLDPGIYSYEDSNASDEQKLAMGFPKAMWHSEITVTGYWADNNKSTGYINIVVRDCNSDTPRIYENLFSWNEWRGWQAYALKSDLQSNLLYKEFTTESRSWKTLECYRLSYTAPNGYKFLTICYTRTNSWIGATYAIPIIGSFDFDIYVSAGSGNGSVTLGALFVKNV